MIAAAVICTGMAVTVAAKEFFKWNDYLVKRLDPSEEQQETLQESTYIQNIDQSVTQNGVTVTWMILQTSVSAFRKDSLRLTVFLTSV